MGAKKLQKTAARSASRSIIGKIKTQLGINNSRKTQKKLLTTKPEKHQKNTTEKNTSSNASKSCKNQTSTTEIASTSSNKVNKIAQRDITSPSSSSSSSSSSTTTSSSNGNTKLNIQKPSLQDSESDSLKSIAVKGDITTTNSPSMLNNKATQQQQQQQQHQKTGEDKAKAINKMLKSLDIKISGFKNILSDDDQKGVECKASISEIVKTKYRAAAVKTSTNISGSNSKALKKDENNSQVKKDKDKEEMGNSNSASSKPAMSGNSSPAKFAKIDDSSSKESSVELSEKTSQNEMITSNTVTDPNEGDKSSKIKVKTSQQQQNKSTSKKEDESLTNVKNVEENSETVTGTEQQPEIIKKNKNKSQAKSQLKPSTATVIDKSSGDLKEMKSLEKNEKHSNDDNVNLLSSNDDKSTDKKEKALKSKAKDSVKTVPVNRKKMKSKIKESSEQKEGNQKGAQRTEKTKELQLNNNSDSGGKGSTSQKPEKCETDNSSTNSNVKKKKNTPNALTKKNESNENASKKKKAITKKGSKELSSVVDKSLTSEQKLNEKNSLNKNEENIEGNNEKSGTTNKNTAKKVQKTSKKVQKQQQQQAQKNKKTQKNSTSTELLDNTNDVQSKEKSKIKLKSKCNKSKLKTQNICSDDKNTHKQSKTANVANVMNETEKDKKPHTSVTLEILSKATEERPEAISNNKNEKSKAEQSTTTTTTTVTKKVSILETTKSEEDDTKSEEKLKLHEKKTKSDKRIKSPSKSSKALSVREKLQKKYVKPNTFKPYRSSKQETNKNVKKSELMSSSKEGTATTVAASAAAAAITTSNAGTAKGAKETEKSKPVKDVYDFKTESEEEDNIKMNLLNETVKAILEKDFSDEDDKPLHLTKLELENEDKKPLIQCKDEKVKKENKEKNDKNKNNESNQKRTTSPTKNEKKTNPDQRETTKTPTTPVKTKEDKKQVKSSPKKTAAAATTAKRAKEKNDYRSSSSSSENSTDSEDNNLHLRKKASFGPKRMASLNALAKVQCLYENESRTAHELGLSKTMTIPKIKTLHSSSGSEEEKEAAVKKESQAKERIKKEPVTEYEPKRELRNAPGLRGVGKHWDFDDVSDFESGNESDIPYRKDNDAKSKTKKRKVPRTKITPVKEKTEIKPKKTYKTQKKKAKVAITKKSESESSSGEEKNAESEVDQKNSTGNKRKREKTDDFMGEFKGVLARKRIAGLNATALVAATYDIERHLDRNLGSDCSSFESFPEDEKPKITHNTKNVKDTKLKVENVTEETGKESGKETSSRPTSSSVVIVQDTDVTITGVYVNSTVVSGQEAYCKMQYRVQSSVTEERVLCPTTIDPPKSYTPLGALSSMRPPGSGLSEGVQQPNHHQLGQPQSIASQQPTTNIYQSPSIGEEQSQHIYPGHHYHQATAGIPSLAASHHQHLQEHPQYPPPPAHHHYAPPPSQQLKYSHLHHHHPLDVPPPTSHPSVVSQLSGQGRCESPPPPLRYQSASAYPSSLVPPPTISMSGSGSSAFCAPMQQSHHDITGYYQPAGPLISPHVLPPVPPPQPPGSAALVSTKQVPSPLSSDPEQHLQQPSQSAVSAAESSDSEVLITGGDLAAFRYSSQPPPPSLSQTAAAAAAAAAAQSQQQLSVLSSQHQQHQPSSASAYTRSMHQMHYPPAYPPSYYSPYPGDAMCYSPPYQPYFPAKVYQTAPAAAYRRYPSYYQPGPPPPADLYEPPSPSSAVPPPPTGSQLVPAGPTAPQHMEHYPGPPGFYSGYSPGGGQCYSRSIQPPYMDYPAPCPCPMQTCPKNVLTGPLIGSNSGSNNNSNVATINNSNTVNSLNLNSGITTNNNNNSISSINANSNNNSTQISQSSVNNSNNNLSTINQTMKSNKGPVSVVNQHSITTSNKSSSHNHLLTQQMESANVVQTNGGSILGKSSHLHHHHNMHQCKMEIIEPPTKPDLISITSSDRKDETKSSQYEEEVVIPPTPPVTYTINDKLIEPDITVSPARGSTGLPTVPTDQTDTAATAPVVIPAIPVNSASQHHQPLQIMSATIPRESAVTDATTPAAVVATAAVAVTNLPPMIGRKARIGKSMAREMMYGAATGMLPPSLPPVVPQSAVSLHHHQQQHQQQNNSALQQQQQQQQQIFSHHLIHHHVPPTSHHSNIASEPAVKVFQEPNSTPSIVKPDLDKVKKEEIKTEDEDVVVILDDDKQDVKKIKQEPEIVEVFDDRIEPERRKSPIRIADDLFGDFKEPRTVKRMKILEVNKSQCKKSPPNGYKSLIKQTERKPYLCISRKPEKKEHFRKVAAKSGVKKRKLMLTEQQKNRLMIRKRKLLLMEKERQEQNKEEINSKSPSVCSEDVEPIEIESSPVASPIVPSPTPSVVIANVEHEPQLEMRSLNKSKRKSINATAIATIAPVINEFSTAKGYFSEPDVRTTATGRKSKKTKSTESRSKSETKKSTKESKQQKQQEKISSLSTSAKNQNCTERSRSRAKSKSKETHHFSQTSSMDSIEKSCGGKKNGVKQQNTDKVTKSKSSYKTSSSKTAAIVDTTINNHYHHDDSVQGTFVVDRTINNNILEANNNNKLPENVIIDTQVPIIEKIPSSSSSTSLTLPSLSSSSTASATITTSSQYSSFSTPVDYTEDLMPHVQPLIIHPTTKRQRSRTTRRFTTSRKRKRNNPHVNDEVNEVIPLPRKLNVVPRWNNGWSWEGEPFQGKVFLNSDDPLVVRTCYPSMKHVEGDVIRPRDCVLLRAGSKKNELPYVAKVAHLWENPEDGEMMMSLLWYYRPEHTEQGRQPNDCQDEVFASRHRDHNSVACIEDKCYVLTFAEYCRYRRSVRAAEEGIDEPISIVPPLHNYRSPRDVPLNTNPELVMFCQRVYEFRLKRLLKTPNS